MAGADEREPLLGAKHAASDEAAAAATASQPAAADIDRVDTSARLDALRQLMSSRGLDAYIVPSSDPHDSEYVGDCDKRREYISGFSGSAGTAIVEHSKASLFTDGRYHVQAAKQLDSNWTLQKVGVSGVLDWDSYLEQLHKRARVGVDPRLISYRFASTLVPRLQARNIELVFDLDNLVDRIWTARPKHTFAPIESYPVDLAGATRVEKLATLREALPSSEHCFVLSALSPIAHILNLRSDGDIAYTPVCYAYLIVNPTNYELFIERERLTKDLVADLERDGGKLAPLDDVFSAIKGRTKVCCGRETSWALTTAVDASELTVMPINPALAQQAVKNPIEIEGLRCAYRRDAVAWARWAAVLEKSISKRKLEINEYDAAAMLTQERSKQDLFAGLAYENISATNENAAIVHYATPPVGSRVIDRDTPYLNDSGAQYRDGTIDTTRTVHFGSPTEEQKHAFTRVLQGHIAIDSLVFPKGTNGYQIDAMARRALWSDCLNYAHGTGHGVGHYLGVHEGLHGLGTRPVLAEVPLEVGHVTSNEPGFYKEGEFGIRTESMLVVQELKKGWLKFERLTLVPIQPKLVDFALLNMGEIRWLRSHNLRCYQVLKPLLKGHSDAINWLNAQRVPAWRLVQRVFRALMGR